MGKHVILSIDDVGLLGIPSYAAEMDVTHVPAMPNMALLEAKGVRFTRAYANTLCGPTRMLSYSGKYAYRTGVGSNVESSLDLPPLPSPTGPDKMLPELMTGHNTAMFGKWHLATAENGGVDSPITTGKFDEVKCIPGNVDGIFTGDTYWWWQQFTGTSAPLTGPTRIGTGNATNRTASDYLTKTISDDALAWLTANGGSGDWIIWINHNTPHTPLHQPNTAAERTASGGLAPHMSALMEAVTTAYFEIIQGTDVAANTAYLEGLDPPWIVGGDDDETLIAANIAMIETWDYELGLLLAHAEVDLDTDTTIWFFSDNGPKDDVVQQPFDPTHGKQSQYELGVNIPFVVAGSAVATSERGKVCRRLTHITDIMATIAAIEGVDISAENVDGVDISPYFANVEEHTRARDFVYTEKFKPPCHGGIADSATGATNDPENTPLTEWERAIQDEGWKLVTLMPEGPTGPITYELYNIKGGDRQETKNLIRNNLLTLAGVNHSVEAWEALQRLLAAEAALLP